MKIDFKLGTGIMNEQEEAIRELLLPFSKIESLELNVAESDLEKIALQAGIALAKIIQDLGSLGTFKENGVNYNVLSFGYEYQEPLVIEAWLTSYLIKNNLFEELITCDESAEVLKEEYGIGYGEPFRPTNYVDSEEEYAYDNVLRDQTLVEAIEDKLILFIGVIGKSMNLDIRKIRSHFSGDSDKLYYFEDNKNLLSKLD